MIYLTAGQKNLEGIYCTPTELYIVPSYQRPYSWTFDQCGVLFRDLISAFENKESYFLGNIILARSQNFEMDGKSFVVDGQQRLITLWTLIKVLAVLLPKVNTLKTALSVMPWTGNNPIPKIESEIFENRDNSAIMEVFNYSLDNISQRYNVLTYKKTVLKEDKCSSRIEASLLFFYEQISNSRYLSGDKALMDFSQFLMKRIMLLPIVQNADEEAKALEKALTIFETINNRGLNLEDADIFKAKLYNSAYKDNQKQEFINFWSDFKEACSSLNMTIDDMFRFYSHVIRGKEGITTNEKRLRDFFTNESFSPLKTGSYQEVLGDLSAILSSVKYLKRISGVGNKLHPGSWIQILLEYTNQYPIYAIVVYLYNHNVKTYDGEQKFVRFLKSLVRYCLFTGSTTSVKYGIYTIIKTISYTDVIDNYYQPYISADYFNHLGRLKNSFALLAYLQETGKELPENYSIDRIVNPGDENILGKDWDYNNINEICDSLGNLVVLDIPKKYISLVDKPYHYGKSKNEYVLSIFKNHSFGYKEWKERDEFYKNVLVEFFKGEKK